MGPNALDLLLDGFFLLFSAFFAIIIDLKGRFVLSVRSAKFCSGMTLIEILVAVVVITVGVLGAMMYRYHSAMDARKADVQMGAGRVALLIIESWKGQFGSDTFDPSDDIGLAILNSDDITLAPKSGEFYPVQLSGGTDTYYYAKLDPPVDDIDGDGNADAGIVKLNVSVIWKQNGASGTPSAGDEAIRSVKLSSVLRSR